MVDIFCGGGGGGSSLPSKLTTLFMVKKFEHMYSVTCALHP